MKCNKCNQEIPDNSKFCLHCGAKVDVIDGTVCPRCGYKNPLDARFCTECGSKLTLESTNSQQPLIWKTHYDKINIEQGISGKFTLCGKHGCITNGWEYERISPINKSFAIVYNSGKCGLLNYHGLLVVPCIYSDIDCKDIERRVIRVRCTQNDPWTTKDFPCDSLGKY